LAKEDVMGQVVQRHTTFTDIDDYGNIQTANLAPGDELPDWAPDTVKNNKLLFEPIDGTDAFIVDEDTGTEVHRSEVTPEDHTSPTVTAGYEGGGAEATEASRQAGGEYADMKKDELQALLEERQLPVSGNRQDLIERLEQSDSENG
jgi:hypothetical protein